MTEIHTALSRLGDCRVLKTTVVLTGVRVQNLATGDSRVIDASCSHRSECLTRGCLLPSQTDCPLKLLC